MPTTPISYRLEIRTADDTDDALVATSAELLVPRQGDGLAIDPITGAVTTGAIVVELIDVVVEGGERLFTDQLTDDEARQQLLSRRAYIKRSTDGGDTWPVFMAGFLSDFTLPRPLVWSITIGDSQRLDNKFELYGKLTDAAHPDVTYGGTYFVGGPVKGGFGPIPNYGGWRFRARDVQADLVEFEFLSGVVRPPSFVTGAQSVIGVEPTAAIRVTSMPQETRLRVNAQARPYMTQLATPIDDSYMEFPGLRGEVIDPTDGSTVGVWTPYDSANAFGDPTWLLSVGGRARLRLAWTDADAVAQPSVGDEFDIYVGPDEVSERNPFHVVGHPVDIALSAWEEAGIPYDAAAADDVKTILGAALKAHLRYTKGLMMGEALRESLFGPFGVSWRVNDAGERVMFVARRMPITTPTVVITEAELRAPGTAATGSERTVVNRVAWGFKRFFLWTQAEEAERPPDDIVEQKITYRHENGDPDAPHGEREVAFALPGALYNAGDRFEPDLYSAEIARVTFLLYGRGANEPELPVFAAGDANQGDFVIVEAVHVPGASDAQTPTSQRGTARVMMVTKRTPVSSGADLRLLDVCDAALFPDPLTPPVVAPDTIPPVTGLANSAGIDDTQRLLTWTVGSADYPVEVLLRLSTDASSVRVILLPAGSDRYTLTGLTPGASYVATVRHRDVPPGTRVSTSSTTSFTLSGTAPTLTAPVDPAIFAGSHDPVTGAILLDGSFGLEVTATEIPSDVEFEVAVETGVGAGTYGSYALADTVTSVQGGRTRFTAFAPNDGLRRSIRARHARTGATASSYTTALSVLPWSFTALPSAAPTLVASIDGSGNVSVRWTGPADMLSIRVAATAAGFPTDATVRAATALNGRTGTSGTLVTLTVGQTASIKAFGYTGLAGGGTESAAATLTITFNNGVLDAQYLALATHSGLTSERVFTPSARFSATDGGAGGTYALDLSSNVRGAGVGCEFGDGVTAVLTAPLYGIVRAPYSGTITGLSLFSPLEDATATVDIWVDTYANAPPTIADTIFGVGSTKPNLTTTKKYEDTTLTGVTTAIVKGQLILFKLEAVTLSKLLLVHIDIAKS